MIEIGGIPLPIHTVAQIQQQLIPLTGAFRQRMESGALRQQVHWTSRKWRVELSGAGTLTTGVTELDFKVPVLVKLDRPLEILSASNIIVLPAERRSDTGYEPQGWARIGSKYWESSPASLDGNTLTITPVAGAVQYRAIYYPELSIYSDGPREEKDMNTGLVTWALSGEQI